MTVSAPGKLLLVGEYAVLEGATAIVAAIDRRAKGDIVPRDPARPTSAIVAAVIAEAERRGNPLDHAHGLEIDTSGFYDAQGQKLGLGSSSAVAVVAAALVSGRGDEAALDLAVAAHLAASNGEGSGVDVAASYYGGVIAARKQPSAVAPLASRIGNLHLSVLFTNKSAQTSELVAACRRSAKWGEYVAQLKKLAAEGVHAWETQAVQAFLSVVARYGRAMAGLGRDAGVPVVTEELAAIMRLADESRTAAAKPSGAGGGDVAVVFSFDVDTPRKIAEKTGALMLELAIDRRGLSRK